MTIIETIGAVAIAVTALAGIATAIYRQYFSPAIKKKRQAVIDGKKAIDKGDVSGITRVWNKLRKRIPIIILVLLLAGCAPPKVKFIVLDRLDIVELPKGTNIVLPDDPNWITPKHGYYLSSDYLKDAMEAKVN